jgi:hypothetical protein
VIFTTCCNQSGEALPILKEALTSKGAIVVSEISLTSEDTKNPDTGGEILRRIIEAQPFGDTTKTPDSEEK